MHLASGVWNLTESKAIGKMSTQKVKLIIKQWMDADFYNILWQQRLLPLAEIILHVASPCYQM